MHRTMFIIVLLLALNASNILAAEKRNVDYVFDDGQPYGVLEMVHSDTMNKELPILVFTPQDYQESGKRYPVVYLLHGWNTEPVNEAGLRTLYPPKLKVLELADYYRVIIVTPTIGRTFYVNSPKIPENLYATYVGEEVPAWVDAHYRTQANREGRILAGFSMGGYGAVSLICRYPDIFSVSLSRAGAYNMAYSIEENSQPDVNKDQRAIFGDYWTERKNYHENSCFTLLNQIRDRDDVAFVVEVGREDFLIKDNRKLRDRLVELGMNHIYGEYPGGHAWSSDTLGSLLAHMQYFRDTLFVE